MVGRVFLRDPRGGTLRRQPLASRDQRGHGESEAPNRLEQYNWTLTVDDVHGFIAAMGWKRVRAFGHSAGATAIGSLACAGTRARPRKTETACPNQDRGEPRSRTRPGHASFSVSGLHMIEIGQYVPNLTSMAGGLLDVIRKQQFTMYPAADLREAVSKTIAIESSRGWRLGKAKASDRVDPIVALAMALLVCVRGIGGAARSRRRTCTSFSAYRVTRSRAGRRRSTSRSAIRFAGAIRSRAGENRTARLKTRSQPHGLPLGDTTSRPQSSSIFPLTNR